MRYCKNCGNQLSSGVKFCNNCGTPVTANEQDNRASVTSNEQGNSTSTISNEQHNPPLSNNTGHKSTQRGGSSDTVQRENRTQRSKQPKDKRKIHKWLIAVGATLILILAGVAVGMALNNANGEKSKQAATEPKEEENVKPPSISQEDVATLFRDWQLIKQEIVNIDGTYYTVLAIGQNEVEYEETVKIATLAYEKSAEDNKWRSVWESEEYFADPIINLDNYIGDFYVLNPKNTSLALVVFNIMHAGTGRSYDTQAFQIDQEGMGKVAWSGYGSYIEEKKGYIEVMVHGAVQLAVEKDNVKITEIPRSEVGSKKALKVEFTLGSNGLVAPVKDKEIYVKKGQPITFVPGDNKTKNLFDKGNISIYYSNTEYGPVTTANANLVYAGNEFAFTDEGTYEFLLDYYREGGTYNLTPPYTFKVHVGDGKKPSENKNTENKPSFSSEELEAPFPLGTALSELKDHYGEPSYNDYYMGGRLVVFDQEGYFIDESNETVDGYYFAAPTLSVFGATVGMTGEEINEIYSEKADSYFDTAETQNCVYPYNKNGYKIFFHSKEENGPTTTVIVVRN